MDMQVHDQFYDVVMVGGGAANGAGTSNRRADADVRQTVERLRDRRIPDIVVTTPDGELPGVPRANDE